ncbi:MAG TPA: YkgJ family cysteine cluster protein [Gemmataceae bacterium]|nr:YkgJ family cysteine cluster protein [Gemmataceae bacterium]
MRPFLSRLVVPRASDNAKALYKKGRDVWKGPVYDCQQCGACCTNQGFDPAIGYVYLTKDESKQMSRLGLTVVRTGGSSFLGTHDREGASNPSCVALRGRVGGPCRCAIYRSRPANCRQFEVGSSSCKAAREEAGLPV